MLDTDYASASRIDRLGGSEEDAKVGWLEM